MTVTATAAPPAASVPAVAVEAHAVRSLAGRRVLAVLRIVIGWTFLWAFLDKTFALGFSTESGNGWIEGGSPTTGYLMGASEGWFGGMFEAMAGQAWADWLFMLALLGLGVAAVLGIGLRIAAVVGVLVPGLMYLSQLPFESGVATNPLTTAHWYYALLFVLFPLLDAGRTWGLADLWERVPMVRAASWLR